MDKSEKKERVGQSIKIKRYDDIFDNASKSSSDMEEKGVGHLLVSPTDLKDFKDHPFKVDGKGIKELLESIREQGILSPIIVRPADSGGYEIISGHRRKLCALELELSSVPVIVRDIDDDEAVLAMVDSNIQREDILPSEKAFAYKMKLEAIKRQGERTDLACGQVIQRLSGSDFIGAENNESGRQIRRYIRLTELPIPLLKAIDAKKMSFNAGVELSFLSDEHKKAVEDAATKMRRFPSLAQAKKIREMAINDNIITENIVADVLMEQRENKRDFREVNLERDDIRAFFPKEFTVRQIEEAIIEILKELKTRTKTDTKTH